MCESVFKVLVIGEPTVGKTSMVSRYCCEKWLPNYKATVGADYAVKTLKWSSTETVKLHIWDIAGQDHFRAMTRTYYKGASGCIVMFDLTERKSFEEAKAWKKDLDEKVFLPNLESIPCVLMANKDDLPDKAVSSEEIAAVAKDSGFFHWELTSVKENRNIVEPFNQLVQKMLEQEHETVPIAASPDDDDGGLIKLEQEIRPEAVKGGCCPWRGNL